MEGTLLAFIIWTICGVMFITMGIYAHFSKKLRPMGFWSNCNTEGITDVKKYNAAVGKLFCMFGVVFIFLGTPLLAGQNSSWIILSILGVMAEAIIMMTVYTTVIEKKYREKR